MKILLNLSLLLVLSILNITHNEANGVSDIDNEKPISKNGFIGNYWILVYELNYDAHIRI